MTQAAVTHRTRISLVSVCPRCGHEQPQWYSHTAILTLLRRGDPVEGYCVVCQEFWQLGTREREGLAAQLPS